MVIRIRCCRLRQLRFVSPKAYDQKGERQAQGLCCAYNMASYLPLLDRSIFTRVLRYINALICFTSQDKIIAISRETF